MLLYNLTYESFDSFHALRLNFPESRYFPNLFLPSKWLTHDKFHTCTNGARASCIFFATTKPETLLSRNFFNFFLLLLELHMEIYNNLMFFTYSKFLVLSRCVCRIAKLSKLNTWILEHYSWRGPTKSLVPGWKSW